jgi:hypothetical protein
MLAAAAIQQLRLGAAGDRKREQEDRGRSKQRSAIR